MMKRVVWKDSVKGAQTLAPMMYRKIAIARYNNGDVKGWTIGIEGDRNVYARQDCAMNAINKALGGKPRKDGSRLAEAGIKIVGTIDEPPED